MLAVVMMRFRQMFGMRGVFGVFEMLALSGLGRGDRQRGEGKSRHRQE